MIPRKRLDIGWTDLLYGIGRCLWPGGREAIEARLERGWAPHAVLACLSVRSGFDALLHALGFAPGSEILVSAMTIRDMARIVEAHGLVPVPVDLDMKRLAVRPESMAQAVTARTKAIVVAHLFGSRMPMEPVLAFAREHGLLVIEDCAQAYSGNDYLGHPESDVGMFSFGPIKTATALAGGILRFRDASLRDAVRRRQDLWPAQSNRRFLARICKYSLLVLLSHRFLYTLFVLACRASGADHDRVIGERVRGFPGGGFLAQIRRRPSAALLALLERRLARFDRAAIAARVRLALLAIALMPAARRPGDQAADHSYWVFPILHENPEQLMRHLWSRGFDATRGASSLCVVDPPAHRPDLQAAEAEQAWRQLLYLPVHPGASARDIERLARAFEELEPARAALHRDRWATRGQS